MGSQVLVVAKRHPFPSNKVWMASDFQLGFRSFTYSRDQYDGLPYTHFEYCMVMCLSGCVQVLRGNSLDVISAGELLVVNRGELHTRKS